MHFEKVGEKMKHRNRLLSMQAGVIFHCCYACKKETGNCVICFAPPCHEDRFIPLFKIRKCILRRRKYARN